MNYDIHIENLGAIKEADITITPMTILAGENGTGKSFVTKFLYSILNSLNRNIYAIGITGLGVKTHNTINRLILEEDYNKKQEQFLENYKEAIGDILIMTQNNQYNLVIPNVSQLTEILNEYLALFQKDILPNLDSVNEIENSHYSLQAFYSDYKSIAEDTKQLIYYLENPKEGHEKFLKEELKSYLKENFQISELRNLIDFESEFCLFSIKNIFTVKIFKNNSVEINFKTYPNFLNSIFLESPVYWRLLPIIPDEKYGYDFKMYRGITKETLTGVPKHFHDLKELLFTNFKDGERPQFIIDCADKLQEQLKGKFNASNGDLTFENEKGQSISKNLVSFGMTNIGIIQAVLSKNIINKGSFVFIDEPESNLHPEWQAILANVLVHLAKNGVYVIVTTHSSDMLKAFDISTKEQKINEKLSTYYFESNGKLLNMFDEELTPIEQARRKLLETYENLMIRGYLL